MKSDRNTHISSFSISKGLIYVRVTRYQVRALIRPPHRFRDSECIAFLLCQ